MAIVNCKERLDELLRFSIYRELFKGRTGLLGTGLQNLDLAFTIRKEIINSTN